MRVRTQLIVAFLLLSVVPLTGIVLYSYLTSLAAFRRAVEAESGRLAQEMSDRLDEVRGDLAQRLASLGELRIPALVPGREAEDDVGEVYAALMSRLGELEGLVDSFEFTPVAPLEGLPRPGPLPPIGEERRGEQPPRPEPVFIYPSRTLAEALQRLKEVELTFEQSGLSEDYLKSTMEEAIKRKQGLEEEELQALEAQGKEMERLLGTELSSPVRRGGQVIGYLRALVPASQIVRQVLARTPRDEGEVPFALDSAGNLYAENAGERVLLTGLGVDGRTPGGSKPPPDWIVVKTPDPQSDLVFGVARPVQESLRLIRSTAVWNFAWGLAMVAVAMAGVLWLSARMTRNLSLLTAGAERLAAGNLESRVPVRSRDEFGRLADTFNRMSRQLRESRDRLLIQERERREREIRERLLEAENERRGRELEEARQFQLSLLPKELPSLPGLEVAVFMRTATEVGGDYYDFFAGENGELTVAVGDASGHGARAGTMVTVVKGLFSASVGEPELTEILLRASQAIRRMNLGRMNMAVTLARLEGKRIALTAAGMPPALIHRCGPGTVEEVALVGPPLGSMAETSYQSWVSELGRGDTLLLMSDGFPELLDGVGEPLGYRRAREAFAEAVGEDPRGVIRRLAQRVQRWGGSGPPNDDLTFVVLRRTG